MKAPWKAPCQSEACKRGLAEFWEKKRRAKGPLAGQVRDVTAGPESYDDKESLRLHRQRLLDGYAAACERLPRGYTMSFSTWVQTIGDGGTCWADRHWLNTSVSPLEAL